MTFAPRLPGCDDGALFFGIGPEALALVFRGHGSAVAELANDVGVKAVLGGLERGFAAEVRDPETDLDVSIDSGVDEAEFAVEDGCEPTALKHNHRLEEVRGQSSDGRLMRHVLWDESTKLFRMWYSGGEQNEPNAIGYATSSDGLTWSMRAESKASGSSRIIQRATGITRTSR